MTDKHVYFFGGGEAEGDKSMKNTLGGKGANLAEMTNVGLPVPPGFTITTQTCIYYSENKEYPEELEDQIDENLDKLEKLMGKKLGDNENPLLVSVRSGARISMPGMMDTVLNLGLNDESVQGFIKQTDNERLGWDSYRRFINMFGDVVKGVDHEHFEAEMDKLKKEVEAEVDTDLSGDELKELVERYKKVYKDHVGEGFPEDPKQQLLEAVNAVFESWDNPRARSYRNLNDIPHDLGTAVNVQVMVFGNMGDTSGTGVSFTRNPSTGDKEHYGECLINAQGEDVVAGIRTPEPIDSLKSVVPDAYEELLAVYDKLEEHYKDMQDFEFTIESGELFILQTRDGKRTAQAAVKIAVDMVEEGLIDEDTAVLRVNPNQLEQLLHKQIDPEAEVEVLAKGLPASPGAAVGKVYFTADEAEAKTKDGEDVILVRVETSPDDIHGMAAAQGVLTSRGGMTSHAAVVARGMGKCCVAGAGDLAIDYADKSFKVGDVKVKEGEVITLNGTSGEIVVGEVPLVKPELKGEFKTLMNWADEKRVMNVRTNADTPADSRNAIEFGAEGIGLCRTEHMFFEEDRIKAVREMILAENQEDRKKALLKILPMQRGDFEGIFKVMDGKPVTIRLLDPPLHEFLPHEDKDIKAVADEVGVKFEDLKSKVESLTEMNPMLGHRGCRLAVTYPEIAEMQAQAIMEAACTVAGDGVEVIPEIMIPLVGSIGEYTIIRDLVDATVKKVMAEKDAEVEYKIGTMIEIPRAALIADQIASEAEFFSFGTNDLTQMTFGFSRDDVGTFIPEYIEKGIFEKDPFQVLDQEGVGQLVESGVSLGRKAREDLKVGICGEHGGEPASVKFCHQVGMNYVSCSPFRVPVARLAAAQAQIENPRE